MSPSSPPSDLHTALARVEARLRRARAIRMLLLVLCAVLTAATLRRVMVLTDGVSAPLWALGLLAGIMALCAFAGLLLREGLGARPSLAQAAVVADRGADTKDELTSALWFADGPAATQWVTHHIARATATAQALDVARVAPLRLPSTAWAAGALAIAFMALPSLSPALRQSLQDAQMASWQSGEQGAQSRRIRELIKHSGDTDAAKKLEQALASLERKDLSDADKRKAMAEAKEAVERQNLEVSSMREGLMQLAERLRSDKDAQRSGDDNPGNRADRAKELLDRMLDPHGRPPQSADLDPETLAREKELEKLLDQASKITGNGDGQNFESAKPKAAVDRLDKIARQLEQQASAGSAMRQLTQMQQLQVQQTTVQSAGRYSTSQAQQNQLEGTPSPDSGETAMKGGIMFRTAAVAKGDKPSQSQEGSKSGAAEGESQADPVLGKKESPLAVKLKKEVVRKEGEEGEAGAEGWIYRESQAQSARVALQSVRASTRYVQGEAMEPEQISVKHRQVVKDYFLNLHEVKPQ